MEIAWAEFWLKVARTVIVEAPQYLAWPTVAVVGLLLFREPLSKFIGRVRRFGWTGAEVEPEPVLEQEAPTIQERIDEARDQIAETLPQQAAPAGQGLQLTPATPLIATVEGNITETLRQRGLDNFPPADQRRLFIREYAILVIRTHFEQVGRVIFGTQILLLKRIRANGSVTRRDAMAIFRRHVRRVRDTNTEITANFDGWIAYLLHIEFISADEQGSYALLPQGEDFLSWAQVANINEDTRHL